MDGVDDVQFLTDTTKSTFKYSCSNVITRLIPVAAVASRAAVLKNYLRVPYPFLLAHDRTAHSMHSYTSHNGAVVWCGTRFLQENMKQFLGENKFVWLEHHKLNL